LVASEFNLNAEQNRVFRLVANHATDLSTPPLRMYLGGVGGTGKTPVIKALVKFFEDRSESHRFIVLGRTGTGAALLNGSKYHLMLGLRDYGQRFRTSQWRADQKSARTFERCGHISGWSVDGIV
jgi:hypothetical protein